MREFLHIATQRNVVRRAILYAVVVGMLLVLINYGDAILSGGVKPGQIIRMAITVLVPYMVSTLSSVAAVRESRRLTGSK